MQQERVCELGCHLERVDARSKILVHGAREHNLKNLCFEIPKGKLVALTGPSGSGKSSIAVEILQNECLRQFLESLGMTTDHLAKANVDQIQGLSPSIGVTQRVSDFNPRSTVGTKTGILTILRNLFASIGSQCCSGCGKEVKQPLQDPKKLETVEIEHSNSSKKEKRSFFGCPSCGYRLEKLKMAHFSSNTLAGACEVCKGAGETIEVDLESLIDEDKSLLDGGITIWEPKLANYYAQVVQAASRHYQFAFDVALPLKEYTEEQRNFLLYGIASPNLVNQKIKAPKKVSEGRFEGVIPPLLDRLKKGSVKKSKELESAFSRQPCRECYQTRLKKIGREATVYRKKISEVTHLTMDELVQWISTLEQEISPDEERALRSLSGALKERVSNLIEVGLGYLTLDRTLPSLSAGESQRLRLAGLLGSGLTGVLYVLDEPTAGLHPYDSKKLMNTLRRLQEAGNTVLVIEHDPEVIRKMDYIIDLGPSGGSKGGEIMASGTPEEIIACKRSQTGKYLTQDALVKLNPGPYEKTESLVVRGASLHNLKGVDVHLPINQLVVLTGVSGSGKSTFLFDILDQAARQHFYKASEKAGQYSSIHGLSHFSRVVTVDQISIRKTQSSRSNVATYTKLFDKIRDLFATLPEAKALGFGPDQFSFNVSTQRCENCNGAGIVSIDMAFMPDIEMECPICKGQRFKEQLLTVKFKEHHIADLLQMTVGDALPLFRGYERILTLLRLLQEVGLGYLTLGQSTSTLSGGEAQRLKLVTELAKSTRESTLYLLDEPTNGLHPKEVEILLNIFRKLVAKGHSVILIEHHLDVICRADHLIDFGPGGGVHGGKIVAFGSPREVARNEASLTGKALRAHINGEIEKECFCYS